MERLDSGKVAIVTRAASGIGEACVKLMVERGFRLALVDIDDRAGERLAQQLGSGCLFIKADVTDSPQCARSVDVAPAHFGSVDFLVNNAGGGEIGPSHLCNDASWRSVVSLNLDTFI